MIKNLFILLIIALVFTAYKAGLFEGINIPGTKSKVDPVKESQRQAEAQKAEREIQDSQQPEEVITEALLYLQEQMENSSWWKSVEEEAAKNNVRPWQVIWSRAIGKAETKINYSW